jgi:NAD(P)-dependent dehydrogenase (short-subunit alcohol dehydrogenase family)
MGAYCGSKAALEMLTEVLALELGPAGIRVNAVAPGLVMDEVVRGGAAGLPAYHTEMLRGTPLGRTGAAGEIAEAVVFLASDRSSWTTGSVLPVTGGSHCGRSHLDFTPPTGPYFPAAAGGVSTLGAVAVEETIRKSHIPPTP